MRRSSRRPRPLLSLFVSHTYHKAKKSTAYARVFAPKPSKASSHGTKMRIVEHNTSIGHSWHQPRKALFHRSHLLTPGNRATTNAKYSIHPSTIPNKPSSRRPDFPIPNWQAIATAETEGADSGRHDWPDRRTATSASCVFQILKCCAWPCRRHRHGCRTYPVEGDGMHEMDICGSWMLGLYHS